MQLVGVVGRPRQYCNECWKVERKARYYRYEPSPPQDKTCVVCGNHFVAQGHQVRSPSCASCRTEWARSVKRNARHAYRARKRHASQHSDVSPAFIAALRRRTHDCEMCGSPLGPDAHLDHIVPLNVGGTHTRDNLRFLCPSCNCGRPTDGSDVTNHQLNIWMAA